MPALRNPTWAVDELILALDLYLRRGQPGSTDPDVVELSRVLNDLPLGAEQRADARYRNPNGVAMKLANFARLDPNYHGSGLSAGGKLEEVVWDRYRANPAELRRLADELRQVAAGTTAPPPNERQEGEDEAEEGRIVFRSHRLRERDRALVARKKREALNVSGVLRCEVCELEPVAVYGALGEAVIECHHLVPLSASIGTRTTRTSDLALICRNCHAAIHAGGHTRTLDEVRAALAAAGT